MNAVVRAMLALAMAAWACVGPALVVAWWNGDLRWVWYALALVALAWISGLLATRLDPRADARRLALVIDTIGLGSLIVLPAAGSCMAIAMAVPWGTVAWWRGHELSGALCSAVLLGYASCALLLSAWAVFRCARLRRGSPVR